MNIDGAGTRRGLDVLEAGIVQAIGLTLRSAVTAAEASAKATTRFHDKTGGTRQSIRGQVTGNHGFVRADGAAHFLEWGTAPHFIAAKNASALRFTVGGQTIFRKSVHHPGTRERPFMREARERGEMAAMYGAEEYIGYAIARAH